MCLFSLFISLNIFRSNKCIASYAIVDIDKCAETSVNVQGKLLLLLPKSHIGGKRYLLGLDNSNDITLYLPGNARTD